MAFTEVLYPAVGELQEILGGVNDAHVGLTRLESLQGALETLYPKSTARWSGALTRIVRELKKARVEGVEQYAAWKRNAGQGGFDEIFRELTTGAAPAGSAGAPKMDVPNSVVPAIGIADGNGVTRQVAGVVAASPKAERGSVALPMSEVGNSECNEAVCPAPVRQETEHQESEPKRRPTARRIRKASRSS